MRQASKLQDFLRNPKSRPDLQTPEAQEFLDHLEKHYWNDKTDQLMPWLTREWKKGRIQMPRMTGPDQRGLNLRYIEDHPSGLTQSYSVLPPGTVDHWADWLNSEHAPKYLREKFPDRPDHMQLKTPDMWDVDNDWTQWRREEAARKEVDRQKRLGEVVHQFPDGWTVKRLPAEALEYEGDQMGHCVGGYGNEVRDNRSQIYSLRDEHDGPHATAEILPHDNGIDLERMFREHPVLKGLPDHLKDSLREYHLERQGDPSLRGVTPETHPQYYHRGADIPELYGAIATNRQFRLRGQGPEKGRITQIQGKSDEMPKPEYQARLKQWFQTFPEEDRPNWGNEHSPMRHVGEIPGYQDDVYDGGNYGDYEDDQGGYGPHGDYGLVEPERDVDWDDVIESTWKDRNRYYGYRNEGDDRYDASAGQAAFDYAKQRKQIPEFARALQEHQQNFWDEFDRHYEPESVYNPRSGEVMQSPWGFDGITSRPPDTSTRDEFMDELEKHNMHTWEKYDDEAREKVPNEELQRLYGEYEDQYQNAETEDRDYHMKEWPQGGALDDMYQMIQPHYDPQAGDYGRYVNDPPGTKPTVSSLARRVMAEVQGRPVTADYQGWTNWDTWHTALLMDNERRLYDESRKMIETGRWTSPDRLREWAIRKVLGPHNKQQMKDAQEWNEIPEDERVDHNYEDLKEKSPEAADLVDSLGMGADTGDTQPTLMDPELVNWQEIFDHLKSELDENNEYEREQQRLQSTGLSPDWLTPGHDDAIQHMREALYRHHGALPDEEMRADNGGGYTGNDPRSAYRRTVNVPFDEVVNGPHYHPENHMTLETRNLLRTLLNQRQIERIRQEHAGDPRLENFHYQLPFSRFAYDDYPEFLWYEQTPREERDKLTQYDLNDPEQQTVLHTDPTWQDFAQNGHKQGLTEYTWQTINDLHAGRANDRQMQEMQQALSQRGYPPEQIQQMMAQRRQWDPERQTWIKLNPPPPKAPDTSLDQAGSLTLPPEWEDEAEDPWHVPPEWTSSVQRHCQACGDPLNEDGECSRCDWLDRGWEGWETNNISDPTKDMKRGIGIQTSVNIWEEGNVDKYHQGLQISGQRFPGFVTVYDPGFYQPPHRVFSSTDGQQGFALLDHGDGRRKISGLYNNDPDHRGAGDSGLFHALRNGGNYLECFDRDRARFSLPQHYHHVLGALPTGYTPWDEAYRPPGWQEDIYGTPGIATMTIPPQGQQDPEDWIARAGTHDPAEFEAAMAAVKGRQPVQATYADGVTGQENAERWYDHEQMVNRQHAPNWRWPTQTS